MTAFPKRPVAAIPVLVGFALLCLALPWRAAAEEVSAWTVEIRDGAVHPESAGTLRATEGNTVEVTWTVDEEILLHLHGYNVALRAGPDAPAVMRFEAHTAGRFPVEGHGYNQGDDILLYIEVWPR